MKNGVTASGGAASGAGATTNKPAFAL